MATLAQSSSQNVKIYSTTTNSAYSGDLTAYFNYTISYSGSTLTITGSLDMYNTQSVIFCPRVTYNGTTKQLCDSKTSGSVSFTTTTFTFVRDVTSLYFSIPSNGGTVWYFREGTDITSTNDSYTVTWTIPNSVPSGTLTVSTPIVIGKKTTISWSNLKDSDGDYVYARQLKFYYKVPSKSYYSSTTLFNAKRTSNSYSHLINESYEGYSCYYVLSISDYTSSSTSSYISTTTLTSPTYTIEAPSGNVFVINSGVITESSGIAIINSGVITSMNGDLHSVVNGVIV